MGVDSNNGHNATNPIPNGQSNGNRIDGTKEEKQSESQFESKSPLESKEKVIVHPKLTDFTKGVRVRVKQKKKSSDSSSNHNEPEYVWTEGTVIKGNKRMITIEL